MINPLKNEQQDKKYYHARHLIFKFRLHNASIDTLIIKTSTRTLPKVKISDVVELFDEEKWFDILQ